ncbi:MAG: DNA-processing protein DprA [archaeon]
MSKVIDIKSKEYPELLSKISDAPKKLYYKGNLDEKIFENCLAVVGSRRMTTYGNRVIEQMVAKIASLGITIVSGFMYGVDATAHKAALSVGGKTIAVMPCGANIIHPAYQDDLYNKILENNGLIISEYEDDFQPALWTYPKRNRIVAGLSKATLVVEAALKSGSLITANYTKEYNRKLFVVPGPITSINSEGINQLIKEGASIASKAEDIMDFYKKEYSFSSRFIPLKREPYASQKNHSSFEKSASTAQLENKIIEELQREPLEIDILARNIGISVSEMGTKISLMQLGGVITKQGNKYYIT